MKKILHNIAPVLLLLLLLHQLFGGSLHLLVAGHDQKAALPVNSISADNGEDSCPFCDLLEAATGTMDIPETVFTQFLLDFSLPQNHSYSETAVITGGTLILVRGPPAC